MSVHVGGAAADGGLATRPPAREPGSRTEADGVPSPGPTTVLEPGVRWSGQDAQELWAYRTLLFFLVGRDLRVRYAQTLLGVGWAVAPPLIMTAIFAFVFSHLVRVPSHGIPYPAFALAALVPWTYFSTAVANSANSLINSTNLITKIYFPRLIIPLAPLFTGLVDLALSLSVLFLVMLGFGVLPQWPSVLLVFPLILFSVLAAAGLGCWLAAVNVRYRDVKHVIPFLLQVGMYASPIIYPLSLVPERYRMLFALNPMVGVIEGFRYALFGTHSITAPAVAVSLTSGVVLFVGGVLYFRRTEHLFADLV